MDKITRRQVCLDVERLRNAADRLDMLERDYGNALNDIEVAIQGLKFIVTLTRIPPVDVKMIESRAMDTLRLIREVK
jgi:hypothetical protein